MRCDGAPADGINGVSLYVFGKESDAAFLHVDWNELSVLEDDFAWKLSLELLGRDFRAETRCLRLVVEDGTHNGLVVGGESEVAPNRSPKTCALQRHDVDFLVAIADYENWKLKFFAIDFVVKLWLSISHGSKYTASSKNVFFKVVIWNDLFWSSS